MSYTPQMNFGSLTLFLGVCGTGKATAASTDLTSVSFGTVYAPNPGVTFLPSDVGMPIAIVGGGPVDSLMPPVYFVQGSLFHTTIAAYVSPTEVTLAAAPTTGIFNTGFATVILFRPCPMASDQADVPTAFQWNSSIAPGTADTLQFSTINSLGGALGTQNPYIARFGALQRGQPVYLVSSVTGDVFGGYIDTLTTSSMPGVPGTPYCWSATCASWQGLAKRRVVPPANPQVLTAVDGDVAFRTIVLDYLSDDGVAVTAPTGLPAVTIACAVGANIGQLLDQVVSLLSTATTAYYWTTDAWRTFILSTRAATAAPWSVSDGSDLFAGDTPYQQSIVVTANQLANNVYFIGQSTLLNALNATFFGDGTTKVFNTPLDVGAAPTITLNSGSQTVGILGVDTGKNWYWSPGSTAITQDAGGTVLAASDTLVVSYLTATPAVAQAPNVGSLQQLQAIEGTSANYDYSTSITQPILPNDLLALANGYEAEYGEPATTCQFYTLRPGLATGQLQTIALPDAGIPSGSYLIATLQMTLVDNVIVWQYTAFGGANIGNAITQLTQLINRNQASLNIVTPTTPITGSTGALPGTLYAIGLGTSSIPYPETVTVGDLLWVAQNGPTTQPTDTQGNTYVLAASHAWGGGGAFIPVIAIWYTRASATGSVSVTSGVGAFLILGKISGSIGVDSIAGADSTPPAIAVATTGNVVVTAFAGDPGSGSATVTAPEILAEFAASGPGTIAAAVATPSAGSFASSLAAVSTTRPAFVSVSFACTPASAPPAQVINVQGNPNPGDVMGAANLTHANRVTKVASTGTITESSITDDGTQVTTAEKVGINTAAPAAQLHVVTTSSPGQLLDAYGNAANWRMRRADGTISSPTAIGGAENLGNFAFSGWNGTTFVQAATMIGAATQAFTGSQNGAMLRFSVTANGTTAAFVAAAIQPTGATVIGNAGADDGSGALLQVHGNVNVPAGSNYLINGVPISSGAGGIGVTVYSGLAGISLSGATIYFSIGGGAIASSTEADVSALMESSGTITGFGAKLSAALGTTLTVNNSVVLTWRKNGSPTSVTCTITNPSTSASDIAHSFTYAPGDVLSIQAVFTGTISATPVFVLDASIGATAAGRGGLTLLEQHTAANSAELDFTACLTSSYDTYIVEIVGLIPATSGVDIILQMSTNGGASYDSTSGHYSWGNWRYTILGDGVFGSTGDTKITILTGDAAVSSTASTGGVVGDFTMYNPLSGASTLLRGKLLNIPTTVASGVGFDSFGCYLPTSAVTAFRVLASSGNLASGTVRVYGLAM